MVQDVLNQILSKLESLEKDQQEHSHKFEELNNKFEGLNNNFEELSHKLEEVPKKKVAQGLAPYFDHLEGHMNNKTRELSSSVMRFSDVQEEQHRIMEKLSYRSFQHETEIIDLKRILKNQ